MGRAAPNIGGSCRQVQPEVATKMIAASISRSQREPAAAAQASARERGCHGGQPKAVDDYMAAYARSPRANGVPVPRSPASLEPA